MNKVILFVMPSLQAGGAERSLVNVAQRLSSSHKVHLATVSNQGKLASKIDENITFHDLGGKLRFLYRLPRLVRRLKPDYIFSTLWDMNIITVLLRSFYPEKTRIILREAIMPNMIQHDTRFPLLMKFLYRYAYRRSDQIIALTESMKESLLEITSIQHDKVTVIYNAVPQERLLGTNHKESAKDSDIINFISVGRLSRQKGYDILLDAFAEVVVEYSYLRLTIYGEGPDKEKLARQIRSLSLTDKVKLAGYTENITGALEQADIFISSSRYEGLSNTILEALCNGVPVLAVEENCGSNEVIEHGVDGYLMASCSIEEIKLGLLHAIKNCESLDSNMIRSRARKRFAMDQQISRYSLLLK